jgi:hypothetical protein
MLGEQHPGAGFGEIGIERWAVEYVPDGKFMGAGY